MNNYKNLKKDISAPLFKRTLAAEKISTIGITEFKMKRCIDKIRDKVHVGESEIKIEFGYANAKDFEDGMLTVVFTEMISKINQHDI